MLIVERDTLLIIDLTHVCLFRKGAKFENNLGTRMQTFPNCKMPPHIVLRYHQVHGSMKNCKDSLYFSIKSDQIVLTLDLQVIDSHSVEISWASWDVSTPSKFEAKPGNKTAIATDFDHVLINLHYNSIAVFTIF